ncbi:hypothetical protein HOLleu_24289 [Holothuria leucospilota]|uniref:Uncharacterized protein n=1 Tax=Holothuria leucospilota TaxID=206669 RepID=A0A9Q1BW98_HOLLE|nr:hypothetical protein HOLleu_24289 [Holothuria leucospilota]
MELLADRSVARMKYTERVLVRNRVLTLLLVYPALVENVIVRTDFIYKKGIVFGKNSVAVILMEIFYREVIPMLTLAVPRDVRATAIVLTAMIGTDVAQMQPAEYKTTYDNVTVTRDILVTELLADRSVVRMKYGERVLVRNRVLTLLLVYPALVENVIARTDFICKEEIVLDKKSVAVILVEIFYRTKLPM